MIRIVGSALALAGAIAAVLVAALSDAYLCSENCPGRGWELNVQIWIALAGLVATIGMFYFVIQENWSSAKVALGTALLLFAIWAIVLDAATHGWGQGPVPF
jgi:hypothetical protein